MDFHLSKPKPNGLKYHFNHPDYTCNKAKQEKFTEKSRADSEKAGQQNMTEITMNRQRTFVDICSLEKLSGKTGVNLILWIFELTHYRKNVSVSTNKSLTYSNLNYSGFFNFVIETIKSCSASFTYYGMEHNKFHSLIYSSLIANSNDTIHNTGSSNPNNHYSNHPLKNDACSYWTANDNTSHTLQGNVKPILNNDLDFPPNIVLNLIRQIALNDSERKNHLLNVITNGVKELVNQNDPTAEGLPFYLGISKSVLYKRIKSLTGLTVNNFVKLIRIELASDLLKQTTLSWLDVSKKVGFDDVKYFSGEFKKQFKKHPRDWARPDMQHHQDLMPPINALDSSSLGGLTYPDTDFLNNLTDICHNPLPGVKLTSAGLSSQLGMSKSMLYKKLMSLTGMTVNNFAKAMRIKKASELLKFPGMTVAEAAQTVGFEDVKYFSQEFKKSMGQLPNDWSRFHKTQTPHSKKLAKVTIRFFRRSKYSN